MPLLNDNFAHTVRVPKSNGRKHGNRVSQSNGEYNQKSIKRVPDGEVVNGSGFVCFLLSISLFIQFYISSVSQLSIYS